MAAEVLAPVAGPSSEPIHSITYLSSLSTEQDILQALEDLGALLCHRVPLLSSS